MFEHDFQSDAKMDEVYVSISDNELSKREKTIIKTKKIAYIVVNVIGFSLMVVGIIAFVVNIINTLGNESKGLSNEFFSAIAMFVFGGILSACAFLLLYKLGKKKVRAINENRDSCEQVFDGEQDNDSQIKKEN